MIKLEKDKPLSIYRASAGSGKTHLLTGFYLKQLFLPDYLPETHSGDLRFNEILAVTFTNKATAEMKGRIIDQLHLLSQHPEKSKYWEDVNPGFKKSPDQIKAKARALLVDILNDYASFNISTIDSFFQKVVRSFARELNVSGNYEVELDIDKTLDATLSNFLDKLGEQGNREVFDWLVEFSDKRSEDGSGWDLRVPLLKMAKKALTSEEYRNHSQQIKAFTHDKKALAQYENMLRQIRKEWKENVCRLGNEGLETLQRYGLEIGDFKRSFPKKLNDFAEYDGTKKIELGSTLVSAAEDPGTWFNKTSQYAHGLGEEATAAIQDIFRRCVEHFTGQPFRLYQSAIAIEKNFYELGIMANLDEALKDFCNEQNTMLLNSTNELLARLIGPDDAPFIYEKTGTRIKSYMIDEFQDTSGMQWHNFVPLIDNSLSQGYQDLIVGDVKQSIYRWRGSDWGLLDSQLDTYHPSMHLEDEEALRENWRSLPAIIDFNNQFFRDVAQRLDQLTSTTQVSRIYRDVQQLFPEEKNGDKKTAEGLVHIEFLNVTDEEGNIVESPNADQREAEAMRRLPLQIIKLQQQGFRPRDIAILCRRKKECCKVAETLLTYKQEHPDSPYGMDIISSEALLISARQSVQTVINIMRHLQAPESDIQRMVALSGFFQLEGYSPSEALDLYFRLDADENPFDRTLVHHPLYEMSEQIIGRLPQHVQQDDAPFLQAFRDLVLSFASNQGADLAAFLQWWDQTGNKRSIATPEGQDAIQIMTIHQSKGLGLPAIILPYASWEMDLDTGHDEIIWCTPDEEPFTKDILLPIKLDKSLTNTIFADEFAEERLRAVIDNLNTAYVAFTRAKEAMIIMAPKSKGKADGSRLEDMLNAYCCALPGEEDCFTFGSWQRPEKDPDDEQDEDEEGAELIDVGGESLLFPAATPLPQVSILHSPSLPDITAKHKGTYIHRALQEIRTADDATDVIHALYLRGIIDPTIISEDEMQQTIAHLLDDPQVRPWFGQEMRILNEQPITDNTGKLQRPDRIVIDPQGRVSVIDYKTGRSHSSYRTQVLEYMDLLRQIGFKDVAGYILFIKDHRIVNVK